MPPPIGPPQGFQVVEQDLRQELAFETTNSSHNGGSSSSPPVATLTGLDMSDELRAVFETSRSSNVLPLMYKDLRERLDRASTNSAQTTRTLEDRVSSLTRLVTGAQDLTLDAKSDAKDLRVIFDDHVKEFGHATTATQSDLLVLRGRVESIADTMLEPEAVNDRILILTSRLQDTEEQIIRATDQIGELRELTASLTTENTLLRNRLRQLDEFRPIAPVSRHSTPTHSSREDMTRATGTRKVPVVSQSPVVETASHAFPRREGPALLSPPFHGEHSKLPLEPPTFEEFMSCVRASAPAPSPPPPTASTPLPMVETHGLVTTCDVTMPPMAYPHHVAQVRDREGPYCPGRVPHVPMLKPFRTVVSYGHYRLRDTRGTLSPREGDVLYRVKSRFDSLYSTFAPFNDSVPIKLLEFLLTPREEFDALQVSEAVAALALAFCLVVPAKTHQTAQTSPGVRNSNTVMANTCPYLVDPMLKRYLTDDILQQAYEKVTDAKQKADEDENTFTDRLVSAARDCCNVFEDRELLNYHIRGLLPSTRDTVTERVRQLPFDQQGEMTVARRVAQAEGNTYRARRAANSTSPFRPKSPSRKAMLVTEQDEGTDSISSFRRDPQSPQSVH